MQSNEIKQSYVAPAIEEIPILIKSMILEVSNPGAQGPDDEVPT